MDDLSEEEIQRRRESTFLVPPDTIPQGKRPPRPRWNECPSNNSAPTSAGVRMGANPPEFYFWWGGTGCCGNAALRDQWASLACGALALDGFEGHPDAPQQQPDENWDVSMPPPAEHSNPQPAWAESPEGLPTHLPDHERANTDPALCIWAVDPFWRSWAIRFPPHPVDGGCTASLPFGALRPRNEGWWYRRDDDGHPSWAYQPPLVSNARACSLGWRCINTQDHASFVARFLRYSLRPGEEEGTSVEFLAHGARATASGHAAFALCPACSLAQFLIALRGQNALRWTPRQVRSWVSSIPQDYFARDLLEYAISHQLTLDLSDSEENEEDNDDWVPQYLRVKSADRRILPPRNYKPDGDGGGSSSVAA